MQHATLNLFCGDFDDVVFLLYPFCDAGFACCMVACRGAVAGVLHVATLLHFCCGLVAVDALAVCGVGVPGWCFQMLF